MRQPAGADIRVQVDPTNPGQFFACCGLLELADRLWGGAEGSFTDGAFLLRALGGAPPPSTLDGLLRTVVDVTLQQLDPTDDFSSPIGLPHPFDLRLDWWKDDRAGGDRLKVWAGSMRSARIARAMQRALGRLEGLTEAVFDHAMVVYDPQEPDKKVEPFYFDARRGWNARAVDVGFSPDTLNMTTVAHPAVEFLCLVGLQRCRPVPTDRPRVFDYYTWAIPLEASLASVAVCGLLTHVDAHGFRFECSFRTDQRKHKAFTPATPLLRSQR